MRLALCLLVSALCGSVAAQTPLGEFSPDLDEASAVLQLQDGRVLFSVDDDLVVFTPDGTRLGFFAEDVGGTGYLSQAPDGRVFAVYDRERVEAYRPDGTALGPLVTGLNEARGIAALRDGRIAVATWTPGSGFTDWIEIFSSEGVPLDTLRAADDLYEPTHLMQMDDGRLLVSRLGSGELLIFGEDGTLLGEGASMVDGSGQAVQHPDGRLFATDNGLFTAAICVFDEEDLFPLGPFLQDGLGHLFYPYGMEILDDGRVIVLDGDGSGGYRVVVFGGPIETPPGQPFLAADLIDYGSSDAQPLVAFRGQLYVQIGGFDSSGGVPFGPVAYDLETGAVREADEIRGGGRAWNSRGFTEVAGDLLFVARDQTCGSPSLYAYDPATGTTRCVSGPEGLTWVHEGMEIERRYVFGARDADDVTALFAYDPAADEMERLATITDLMNVRVSPPQSVGGRLYVSFASVQGNDRGFFEYDPATGEIVLLEAGLYIVSPIALDDRLVYHAGGVGGPITVYDPRTSSSLVLSGQIPGANRYARLGENLYVSASEGRLYEFDPATDEIRHVGTVPGATTGSGPLWDLTPAGDDLYFGACGGAGCEVYVFDPNEEEIRLAADVGDGHDSDPKSLVAAGDYLYFGAAGVPGDRELYAVLATPTASEPPSLAPSLTVAPNPASARATVTLRLSTPSDVRLSLHDVLGREVAVLAEGPRSAGEHRLVVDGARLAPGVYVWRLARGEEVTTGRLTVVR